MALRVLQERRYRNPVAAVMLLSDGQDSAVEECGDLARDIRKAGASVHTWGFGADHDALLLSRIAGELCSLRCQYVSDTVVVSMLKRLGVPACAGCNACACRLWQLTYAAIPARNCVHSLVRGQNGAPARSYSSYVATLHVLPSLVCQAHTLCPTAILFSYT
jgi:hypothetical protein